MFCKKRCYRTELNCVKTAFYRLYGRARMGLIVNGAPELWAFSKTFTLPSCPAFKQQHTLKKKNELWLEFDWLQIANVANFAVQALYLTSKIASQIVFSTLQTFTLCTYRLCTVFVTDTNLCIKKRVTLIRHSLKIWPNQSAILLLKLNQKGFSIPGCPLYFILIF